MKTNRKLFILFITSVLTLVGCGGNSTTLNKYQKVIKAFEAVGRTLDLKSNSKNSTKSLHSVNMDGDMSNFESFFANAQTDEKIEDQINFDTPPLMQFQYLKVIYESIGANYSFDTKYAHTVTGDVYIDFETGYKDKEKSPTNKYGFSFDLSVYINIDDEDLITADVGMDITLTHGSESYKYYKYALLILDYDFDKNDDNYELALYDYGENKDLMYLECGFGYEYDYCLVSHGKLTEWRKFRYQADRKMVKDAAHPTLDSYINEGAVITDSNQRWYKNNVLKRIDSKTPESLLIAKELYHSFGLNNTDLNPESFFAKSSLDSPVIQTIYDKASREYGDGLIYHIIAQKEDDEEEDKGWPSSNIEQITGFTVAPFSERDAVTYEFYRDDKDGESASVVITVKGGNAGEYRLFEDNLINVYYFARGEDQAGFHIYYLGLIDNTTLTVSVSESTGTIVFLHYFGGGGGSQDIPYEVLKLDNLIAYDLPYNHYSEDYFGFEKEALNALSNLFEDQNVDKVFSNKINLRVSKKVEIVLSDKDVEYVGQASNVKDARDRVMNMYGHYYKEQWNETNKQNAFMSNDKKDIVFIRTGSEDGSFFIYFFRCVDDTMEKYLKGEASLTISVHIYVHAHDGEVYLQKTIGVPNGDSVLPYLESGINYYLDEGLTILVEENNSYAYEGMVVHRKDYEDPVYETISVPGGIDYKYPYAWKNVNPLDEEGAYNVAMNAVGDSQIRLYLEGNVSTEEDANNTMYDIFIGQDEALYLGKTDISEAAKYIYTQYTKEYSSWKKGTKGDYYYKGSKEEDVVFFDKECLQDGFVNFIHIHLTSPVMANYESASQGGGGETPTTTNVLLMVYSNGTFDHVASVTCPLGVDVRPYLREYKGNYYVDQDLSIPLDDTNCTVTEGMTIYINVISAQEQYTTITLIVNGDTESPQIYEITAKIGDDVYDYISGYADEFYYDSEYVYKLEKGQCSVGEGMIVYGKTNHGGGGVQSATVNVYIIENGGVINKHSFSANVGEDVRGYLDGYDQTGTRYVDEACSTLLDDTNCAIYDGMNIYIVKNSGTQIEEYVTVTVILYNSNKEKTGSETFDCIVGEDVRTYLRKYNGDFFIDSNFTTPLNQNNCKAYEGMIIYVILRG